MTISEWATTPQSYLALVVWINFVVALAYTVASIYSAVAIFVGWHSSYCRGEVRWGKNIFKLVALWSIFVALRYFLGIIS